MRPTVDCPFKCDEKHTNLFEETDPYNKQNLVRGYINRRQGTHYGSLYITHVNERICTQVIPSAPKQHYPFDRDGNWEWPDYHHVEAYEKLDGTCIIAYTYQDADGNTFQSYKTRLRPFLGEGTYGNFKSLWDEMLEKYPKMAGLHSDFSEMVFVYELYGKRNHHLIVYDESLDTRLLFVRLADNPYQLESLYSWCEIAKAYGVPSVEQMMYIDEQVDNLDEVYLEQQQIMTERFKTVDIPVDDEEEMPTSIGTLDGIEGQVWYFSGEDGFAHQVKNKPPEVLNYHWKAVGRDGKPKIPFVSIYTTVVNSLENTDEPTYEFIKQLLLEEFPEDMVERARNKVEKTIKQVLFDKKITKQILDEYERVRTDAFNLNTARGAVMQKFAADFCDTDGDRKKLGSKIYNTLLAYEEGRN